MSITNAFRNLSSEEKRNIIVSALIIAIILGFLLIRGIADSSKSSDEDLTPTPAEKVTPTKRPSLTPKPTKRPTYTPTPIKTQTPTPTTEPTSTPTPTAEPTDAPTPTTEPKVDLEAEFINFNKTPKVGEIIKVAIGIYNKGKLDAGSFWWEWWPKSSDRECREQMLGLASQQRTTVYCSYTFTSMARYETKAIVDSEYEIDESDEGNNVIKKEKDVLP